MPRCRGFTPALLSLKARLDSTVPHLPVENPGSKWPKTSLGCLVDNSRLTPEQLKTLNEICKEETLGLTYACTATSEQSANDSVDCVQPIQITVDSAAVALFACRSLERLLTYNYVAFKSGFNSHPESEEEQRRVAHIVAEADEEGYWVLASKDGNRKSHYTGPHLGATLMHSLFAVYPANVLLDRSQSTDGSSTIEILNRERLLSCIRQFKERVDKELPGIYYWFNEFSLHVTLRGLIH